MRLVFQSVEGKLPLIGVGGIFSAEDAYERICAGASLIQVYTGLIYEGPFLARRIARGLLDILDRQGIGIIAEAVGKEPPPGPPRDREPSAGRRTSHLLELSTDPGCEPGMTSPPAGPRRRLTVYTDGAARGNPGPAGAGVFIVDESGETVDEATQYLQRLQAESGAPGVSAAVAVDGQIVFSGGAGVADLEAGTSQTATVVHNIGSISKTLAVVALMQLVEQGKVDLDDEIQSPFDLEI